jgi:hypothetical protein
MFCNLEATARLAVSIVGVSVSDHQGIFKRSIILTDDGILSSSEGELRVQRSSFRVKFWFCA